MLEPFINDPLKTLTSLEGKDFFSDAYLHLRRRFLSDKTSRISNSKSENIRRRALPAFTEKDLQNIWAEQKLERRNLKLLDGRRLSVSDPGAKQSDGKVHFTNAILQMDGQTVHGDIVVHLRQSDWSKENLHKNSSCDNVVLHATLFAPGKGRQSLNAKGKSVAQLELRHHLSGLSPQLLEDSSSEELEILGSIPMGDCGKTLGFPSAFKMEKLDIIEILLRIAGDARLLMKAGQLLSESGSETEQWNRLFYERVLESLGYSENKSAMRRLSALVRLEFIKTALQNVASDQKKLLLESIFLQASGFLPETFNRLDAPAQIYWQNLFEIGKKYPLRALEKNIWKRGKTRPQNFPERRICGIASMLAQSSEKGLFFDALEQLRHQYKIWQSIKDDPKKVSKQFSTWTQNMFFQEGSGYFAKHATLGGKPFKNSCALIGQERSILIWINAFMPLALAWFRSQKESEESIALEKFLHRVWKTVPVQGYNRVSKTMLARLMGRRSQQFKIHSEQMQQGLIQIFQDFCDISPDACRGCPFPKIVLLPVHEMVRRNVE